MARLFDDAATEYLEVQSTPITAAPFTMACWANTDTLAVQQSMMWIGDKDASADYWSLEVETGGGNNLHFRAHDGPGIAAQTTTAISVDTWHHCCGIEYSNVSRAAILDGGGKGTDNTDKTPDNADSIAIGRRNDTSPIDYMSGSVAEAAIWNVALTDAEVAILAAGFSPLFVRPQNLVFYAPLIRDEDQDRVGGYDLTAFNTPSIATHPPIIYPVMPFVGKGAAAEEGRAPRNPFYVYQVPAVV